MLKFNHDSVGLGDRCASALIGSNTTDKVKRTNERVFLYFLSFFLFFFTSFHNEIENQMPSIILERQLHAAKGTRH